MSTTRSRGKDTTVTASRASVTCTSIITSVRPSESSALPYSLLPLPLRVSEPITRMSSGPPSTAPESSERSSGLDVRLLVSRSAATPPSPITLISARTTRITAILRVEERCSRARWWRPV